MLYSVRRSKRAQRPQLRYSHTKGLEVVLPILSNITPAQVLEYHHAWLVKHSYKFSNPVAEDVLQLRLLHKTLQLTYLTKKAAVCLVNDVLTISGPSKIKQQQQLVKWLQAQATVLLSRLESLSKATGLSYNQASIGKQKCTWGSCNTKKNIRLNYKLIFLPEELVNYVILHELCHTIEHNHSKRFWVLVEKFDINYQQHRKTINANQWYPGFLDH